MRETTKREAPRGAAAPAGDEARVPDRLITPHLVLRKAKDDDLEPIWRNIWSDPDIAKMMLWEPTVTREAAVDRLERTKRYQASNYAYFVCRKDTDEPIGFAGIRETAPGEFEETGICIARRFQNRGYGKELLNALVELVFSRLCGRRFQYGCFRENEPSAALCRHCGFAYSHSERMVRKWDGYEYLCDFYVRSRP
ncbi:MAG: GNAT family N-acetyltransferase [Clostridia bacterium]|nr:GNAT family N-acetyltransferase [Clostridia bacterium]